MRSRGRSARSQGRSGRPRGRSVHSRGRSTGRADRQMTGQEEALPGARLEDFKPAGAGQRRCRSGLTAVGPQPAGRHLGTGKHPAPSVPAAMRAAPAAGRVDLAGIRAPPAAGRVVRAARRVTPEAEAATLARAALGTGTAPRAALGRTVRLARPGLPRPVARLGLPRPLRVGRRRRAGAVSPVTV